MLYVCAVYSDYILALHEFLVEHSGCLTRKATAVAEPALPCPTNDCSALLFTIKMSLEYPHFAKVVEEIPLLF